MEEELLVVSIEESWEKLLWLRKLDWKRFDWGV
jgi:hypothetical protein